MFRLAAVVLALVACGSPQTPSPPPPLPPTVTSDAAVDAPEVAVDDDIHDHAHDDEPLGCDQVVRDIAGFPPVLADDAPERDWQLEIRGHILEEDCEHDWAFEDRQCLHQNGPIACTPQLPNDIATRLAKLDELAHKIAEAKAKPATIACKQVVAAHYADIRWQARLEGFATKVRNQIIADSRTLMQKACTAEKWSPSTRACLVLGGADLCFFTTNIRRMWGYPADGSVKTLGIPRCDEYDALVTKFTSCSVLNAAQRDSLRRIAAALKAQIAAAPPAQRAAKAQGCESGVEMIQNMINHHGC